MNILDASLSPKSGPNLNSSLFDSALSNIINIIVSYGMGWSKRGTGRSYDSLNGYSVIIGFLSGKILDYATRNRKCIKCEKGHQKSKHDCRLNFQGSAKAMEADARMQLINHSKILHDAGLQVRVIIGDEDSSMIAAVKKDDPNTTFYKLADKNHLSRNFSNELYKMRNSFSQLNRNGAIAHIKKCFKYAVSQNKGKSENLAETIRTLPDHLFDRHETCGTWCKSIKKHTVKFTDEALYKALVDFFAKYSANSHKFSVAASSQANESFNNIVSHKAHKNICLSRSAACDIRVADSMCSKNDGESCIIKYKKSLGLPIGDNTLNYVKRDNSRKLKRAEKIKQKYSKLRRIELQKKRENLRIKRNQRVLCTEVDVVLLLLSKQSVSAEKSKNQSETTVILSTSILKRLD